MAGATRSPERPAVSYPRRLSRRHLLLKSFLGWAYVGIPHGLVLYIYGILAGLVSFISSFVILFTGIYLRRFFEFVAGYHLWQLRVEAYVYYFMVDDYPPFFTGSRHSANLRVQYPKRLSWGLALLKLLLGWLYVGIPHGIALMLCGLGVLAVLFLS